MLDTDHELLHGEHAELDDALDAIEAKLDMPSHPTHPTHPAQNHSTPGDVTTAKNSINSNTDAQTTQIDNSLSTLTTNLATHEGNLGTHNTALGTHDANIDGDLVTHEGNLVTETDEIDDALDALEIKVDNHDANIDGDLAEHVEESAQIAFEFGTLVAKVIDLKRVNIELTHVGSGGGDDDSDDDGKKDRYLVATDEAGIPVDVALVSVTAVEVKNGKAVATFDVTLDTDWTPVSTGLRDMTVELPKAAKKAKYLVLRVVHDEGTVSPIGPVAHFCRIMFAINGGGGDDD